MEKVRDELAIALGQKLPISSENELQDEVVALEEKVAKNHLKFE